MGMAGLQLDIPSVVLHGAPLHAVTEEQAIGQILRALREQRGGWVVTHNLDHLLRLRRDRAFSEVCRTASLRVADGMPLVWASRMQGTPLPERVAGSSLIHTLTKAAADARRSIFLLGGDPGTADAAARTLQERYPHLSVAGTLCPPIGFESNPAWMEQIHRTLIDAQPDIVYVALGSPKQERLIVALRDMLPRAWFLGVGISFSFVCGQVKRAPRWMQRLGFEWMHRLIQEPRRLAKRYLIDGLPFAVRLFAGALQVRLCSTFFPAKAASVQADGK